MKSGSEKGMQVGLVFELCELEKLKGIDWMEN